jgi:hypothetical protein
LAVLDDRDHGAGDVRVLNFERQEAIEKCTQVVGRQIMGLRRCFFG